MLIRRLLGIVICSIGVILPWRMRIWYAELLGWTVQAFYLLHYNMIKFMLHHLLPKEKE